MEGILAGMIDMGISLLVLCSIFSQIMQIGGTINVINSKTNEHQILKAELQEYREVNQYINRDDLKAGDVIQFVLKSQGYPAVKVVVNGTTYLFNDETNPANYTATFASSIVDNNFYYKCTYSPDERTANADGSYTYRDYYVFTAI